MCIRMKRVQNRFIIGSCAAVAQWQSRSFPSLRRGFDSRLPLHFCHCPQSMPWPARVPETPARPCNASPIRFHRMHPSSKWGKDRSGACVLFPEAGKKGLIDVFCLEEIPIKYGRGFIGLIKCVQSPWGVACFACTKRLCQHIQPSRLWYKRPSGLARPASGSCFPGRAHGLLVCYVPAAVSRWIRFPFSCSAWPCPPMH